MYAEFSQISVLSMSNTKLFLVKDDDEDEEQGIEFDIVKRRPVLEFQEERDNQATANSSRNSDEEREVPVEDDEEKKGGEYQCHVTASKESEEEEEAKKKKRKRPSLGELKVTGHHDDEDEEEDGFKTPTSFDHKIPVMKQCPPAPRKPKPCNFPSSLHKRKASPTTHRSLQLDLSQEVESLFPKPLLADLHRKIKKARTEDNKH